MDITEKVIEYLWQIIDDIDTTSDMAKGNDVVYRNKVERLQKKRWRTGITTDGYKLDKTKMKEPNTAKHEMTVNYNEVGEVYEGK